MRIDNIFTKLVIHKYLSIFAIFHLTLFCSNVYAAVGPNWIEQYGITWTFDKNISTDGSAGTYQYGQFVNGDYWVVGPVVVTQINPPKMVIQQDGKQWTVNGSQVNPKDFPLGPVALDFKHGFDSRIVEDRFNDDLCLAAPLTLTANESLMSVDSWLLSEDGCPARESTNPDSYKYHMPHRPLRAGAVLTCLPEAPPEGSFRPSYAGGTSNKTLYSFDNVDMSILPTLPDPTSSPSWEQVKGLLSRPFFDHGPNSAMSYLRPEENAAYYARELATNVGIVACCLLLDENSFSIEQKTELAIQMIQLGIDNYGIIRTGGNWGYMGGGMGHGRKLPILIAGALLNDPYMLAIGEDYGYVSDVEGTSHQQFMEDCQTFYIQQSDIDRYSGEDRRATRTNCRIESNDLSTIFDDDDGIWYIADDEVSVILHRSPAYNFDYWLIWNYGTGSEEYVRIESVDGNKMTLRSPITTSPGSGRTARVQLFPQGKLGDVDWGERHFYNYDGDHYSRAYRDSCVFLSLAGHQLAALAINTRSGVPLKTKWCWNPFFDFTDYHMLTSSYGSQDDWVGDMWQNYRANYGPIWPDQQNDDIPPLTPDNLNSPNQTETTISIAWTASGPASDGDQPVSYKIYRNTLQVGTVTGTTFTDSQLLSNTIYSYQVYSVDDAGNSSQTAASGSFSTAADNNAPSILNVAAQTSSMYIAFDETLDQTSANNIANYSITPGITISSAVLQPDQMTVLLNTSVHQENISYTLDVNGVEDIAGNTTVNETFIYQVSNGLVGKWEFNESSGTTAADSSGLNNTATLINIPAVNWIAGGGAVQFDGTNGAVQIPFDDLTSMQGTIALRAKMEDISGSHYLFGHTVGSWSNRIQLYIREGILGLGLGNTHNLNSNIQTITPNIWHHFALTWDGTDVNYVVYVDGLVADSGSYTGLTSLNSTADIGNTGNVDYRTESFHGEIEEVHVYNRVLSAQEIEALSQGNPSSGNDNPIAEAGTDQIVHDTNRDGSEQISLNGSGSSDPDGTIVDYDWSENSVSLPGGDGLNPTVTLSAGVHVITLTVMDNDGAASTDTVTITVNQLPTAQAGPDRTITDSDDNGSEPVALSASGSADADGTITSYNWFKGGNQIASGSAPIVNLTLGTHVITLEVTDNRGATATDTVIIQINSPANQPPVANAGVDQTVTDVNNNGTETINLNGSASTDADGTITSYIWFEGASQIAIGSTPSVTLATGTHVVTLEVTDNLGATATDSVNITINSPTNQSPVANAGVDQTVTDTDGNGTEVINLNGAASSDPDGTITSYLWFEGTNQIASGSSTSVTLSTGTHVITLEVTDNLGAKATDTVTIEIDSPANQSPVANAGSDQTITDTDKNGTEQITLNGSASADPDGTIQTYSWKEGTTQIATGPTPAVTLAAGSHTITLTVTDNEGLTDTDTVTVIVNQLPVAQAGMDQIVSDTDINGTEVITLNGSASADPDGAIQTYSWTEGAAQIAAGPNPTISLAVGTHTISLTVTDNHGASATDTVSIRINQSPVADAGEDQTLTDEDDNGTESVSLDASASSDPDGTITSYLWFKGAQYLGNGQTLTVSLTAGSHTLMLIVADNNGFVATDTVTIRINQLNNQAPVADAGDDLIALDSDTNGNEPITLDGSGSNDPDGTIVSYVWTEGATQIATGSVANLNLLNGEHVITLTATDDDGLTASDTITVTVNQLPVARAGSDQALIDNDKNGTEEVFLDASASTDPDGTLSDYLWFEGGTQIASGVTTTVTLDLRSHAITLRVVDNHGGMATDGVSVSITAPENQPPTANAGTDRVVTDSDLDGSEAVSLNGSASTDSDGTIQSYVWTENATQIATGVSPSATLTQGLHTITLTVTDDGGLTATDTVTVRVNIPPTAQAGPDQVIPDVDKDGSEPVTLSSTGTSDSDGVIAQYLWKEASTVLASGPNPTVNLPLGLHTISLTVTDNFGGSATDIVLVDVRVASDINETDTFAPEVTNCSPAPESIQAPLNSLVVLHVVDSGSGVDSDSVQILMDDKVIYQGPAASYKSNYGRCKRRGTQADYQYTFQSDTLFAFDETVNITVSAHDEVGNVMSGRKYSFKTVMRTFGGDTVIDSETSALDSTTEPLTETGLDITRDNPVTVTDSLGNIWIAWEAGLDGARNIYLAQMPLGSSFFETRVCVADDPHDQCNPSLAVDGNDRLHLTWQDNRRGNWDVYYSCSDDGINFSAPVLVDDSGAAQITPAIAVDNLLPQQVHITWQDNRWGNQDIYLASSSDNFATKTIKALTTNASDQTQPVIAVDIDNVAYVFWTTQAANGSTDIYGASLTGDSWAYAPIVNNTANQSQPALAVEPQTNHLHILWVDDSRGNLDIFYAATSGGLPAEPLIGINIVDDNSSADQVHPALIARLNDDDVLKIFTCWQDDRNVLSLSPDDTDIYFAESDEGFGTNILVTDNDPSNSAQYHPALGLNSQGHPYLIWIDTRSGTPGIRCVGTTLINPQPLASALIEAAAGGVVGTIDNWQQMDSADDIHLEIPAGALWEDVEVTISRVDNPPTSSPLTALDVIARYEFGPSSAMEFAKSVIITIPYLVDEVGDETVFWYNTQTGEYSQSGISNIERVEFSPTLHGIRYKTTHFTEYVIAQEVEDQSVSFFAGGSSGGCSLSGIPDSHGVDILGFSLPYVALIFVFLALKLRDSRSRKSKPVNIKV